jgi:hypothetical protein
MKENLIINRKLYGSEGCYYPLDVLSRGKDILVYFCSKARWVSE